MAARTVRLYVGREGKMSFVYDPEFAKAMDTGSGYVQVRRASDVEPYGSGWAADMRRVGGPVLGPFADRDQAIAAEINWLHANWLGRTVPAPVRWARRLSRLLMIPRRLLIKSEDFNAQNQADAATGGR